MAERIEHAFVRQYAVGKRDLVAGIGEIIGHGRFLLSSGQFRRRRSKAEMAAIAKPPGRNAARASCRDRGVTPLRGASEKDCLAKAPRCQQIARSAASKSENDP
jgi:hypothetical protein